MKRTSLYPAHQRLGGKLIEFGGWEMPVQYTSISDEHNATRNAAGMFDISHMGEVIVSGPGALGFLNGVLTNDLAKAPIGTGQYTLMCNERGGVVDDLYAYHVAENTYFLIINASRITADVDWLRSRLASSPVAATVSLEDQSEQMGAIAVQGPKVVEFIGRSLPGPFSGGTRVGNLTELKKNQLTGTIFNGQQLWVARTGYTGEDGFEVVGPAAQIADLWEVFLRDGQIFGLKPAGLGARDTLRTEACYPLYGHELNTDITPIEAGVGFFVSLDKGDFLGRDVLARQKKEGPPRKLVAFKMAERSAPPRPEYPVWSTGPNPAAIGRVSSGTQSPTLGVGIGLALLPPEFAALGTPLEIEIRSRRTAASVVPKPFYRKP